MLFSLYCTENILLFVCCKIVLFVWAITWFQVQSGINKHEQIFLKTYIAIYGLKKLISAYSFQIAQEKSCNNVLMIYMKKYEIAYHNDAEAKQVHQVQK